MMRSVPVRMMLLAGTLFLCACSGPESPEEPVDLFAQGEFLCREARWGEARDVLRAFLVEHPEHAGAHFYLGRSYLLWEEDFRPAIAEGELQTALALYRESGEHHIERFPDDYFVLICDIESAKVTIKQFALLQQLRFPPQTLLPILDRGWGYVERAREAIPDHGDIADFDGLMRSLYASIGTTIPSER